MLAYRHLKQLENAFWNSIESSTNPADFHSYLDKYPNGAFVVLAQQHMKELANAERQDTARAAAICNSPLRHIDVPDGRKATRNELSETLTEINNYSREVGGFGECVTHAVETASPGVSQVLQKEEHAAVQRLEDLSEAWDKQFAAFQAEEKPQ